MREMTISAARQRPAAPYIESSRIVGSDKKVSDTFTVSISRSPSYRFLHEQRPQFGTGSWQLIQAPA